MYHIKGNEGVKQGDGPEGAIEAFEDENSMDFARVNVCVSRKDKEVENVCDRYCDIMEYGTMNGNAMIVQMY